jgi:hypothetical protein
LDVGERLLQDQRGELGCREGRHRKRESELQAVWKDRLRFEYLSEKLNRDFATLATNVWTQMTSPPEPEADAASGTNVVPAVKMVTKPILSGGKKVAELREIAQKLGIEQSEKLKKQELVYGILDGQAIRATAQKKPENGSKAPGESPSKRGPKRGKSTEPAGNAAEMKAAEPGSDAAIAGAVASNPQPEGKSKGRPGDRLRERQ